MAVTFDAKMTAGNGTGGTYAEISTGGTTISSTGMTVGGSATLLVVTLVFGQFVASPSSITAKWNSVSMTAGPVSGVSGHTETAIFYLVNPTIGNNTLTASWTTTAQCYMSAVSFTGTDTTTPVITSDNATTTDATSLTVTSTSDGATVASYADDTATVPSANFTTIYAASDLLDNAAASYQLGGTSNVHTFTATVQTVSVLAGIHIVAPTAGVSIQPDEDFWDRSIASKSMLAGAAANQTSLNTIITALLLNDQDLAGPLFGQPDEDYWSVFVVQPIIPVISIFS